MVRYVYKKRENKSIMVSNIKSSIFKNFSIKNGFENI